MQQDLPEWASVLIEFLAKNFWIGVAGMIAGLALQISGYTNEKLAKLLFLLSAIIFAGPLLYRVPWRQCSGYLCAHKALGVALFALSGAVIFGGLGWVYIRKPESPILNPAEAPAQSSSLSPSPNEGHDKAVATKRRAHSLSVQIFDFLAEWEKNKPEFQGPLAEMWGKKDFNKDEFNKSFGEAGERDAKYASDLSIRFAQEFSGRVSAVRDELASANARSAKLDKIIADNLRFNWDIQTAAEELQKLSEQLPD